MRFVAIGFRVALVVGILIVAGVIFAVLMSTKTTSERNTQGRALVVVRAVVAEPRSVERVWEGFGTVRTMVGSDIVAQVAGRVVARPADIEPGERVAMGDLIVQLDDSDYANALEAARQAGDALQAQVDGLAIESEIALWHLAGLVVGHGSCRSIGGERQTRGR